MPTAKAAALRRTNTAMSIENVEVGPLAAGDVLVRIRAASLCHTDLEAIEGALAAPLPAVLGHEAAGEIAEVGPGVETLGVGDRYQLESLPGFRHAAVRAHSSTTNPSKPPVALTPKLNGEEDISIRRNPDILIGRLHQVLLQPVRKVHSCRCKFGRSPRVQSRNVTVRWRHGLQTACQPFRWTAGEGQGSEPACRRAERGP